MFVRTRIHDSQTIDESVPVKRLIIDMLLSQIIDFN